MSIQRILVGVDGSPNSLDAVGWVAELADRLAAEVTAVHVLGMLERMGPTGRVPVEGHEEAIEELFTRQWCAPLHGVAHRCRIEFGSPLQVLLEMARREQADLVVVGRGNTSDLVMGSTSEGLVQRCPVPTVVVPLSAGP